MWNSDYIKEKEWMDCQGEIGQNKDKRSKFRIKVQVKLLLNYIWNHSLVIRDELSISFLKANLLLDSGFVCMWVIEKNITIKREDFEIILNQNFQSWSLIRKHDRDRVFNLKLYIYYVPIMDETIIEIIKKIKITESYQAFLELITN